MARPARLETTRARLLIEGRVEVLDAARRVLQLGDQIGGARFKGQDRVGEVASERLESARAAFVQALEPESSADAVAGLQDLFLRGGAQIDAAELALTALAQKDRLSTSMRAKGVLECLIDTRHDRAVAAIEKLGGKFTGSYLQIDGDWKGGQAGLAHIRRVRDLTQINIEPTASLDDAAIAALEKTFTGEGRKLMVFGRAFLGVAM